MKKLYLALFCALTATFFLAIPCLVAMESPANLNPIDSAVLTPGGATNPALVMAENLNSSLFFAVNDETTNLYGSLGNSTNFSDSGGINFGSHFVAEINGGSGPENEYLAVPAKTFERNSFMFTRKGINEFSNESFVSSSSSMGTDNVARHGFILSIGGSALKFASSLLAASDTDATYRYVNDLQ